MLIHFWLGFYSPLRQKPLPQFYGLYGKAGNKMKQPKKLKHDYKLAVSAYGLIPNNWMLQKDGDVYITIVNKKSGKTRIIDKYARKKKTKYP